MNSLKKSEKVCGCGASRRLSLSLLLPLLPPPPKCLCFLFISICSPATFLFLKFSFSRRPFPIIQSEDHLSYHFGKFRVILMGNPEESQRFIIIMVVAVCYLHRQNESHNITVARRWFVKTISLSILLFDTFGFNLSNLYIIIMVFM